MSVAVAALAHGSLVDVLMCLASHIEMWPAKKYIALSAYVRCRRWVYAETAVVFNRAHTCISLNNNATPSANRNQETRLVRK